MERLCPICGDPLSEKDGRICYACRYDEFDDEVHGVRRCDACGKPMRFGRCWSCAAGDDGKPCDPGLLSLAFKRGKKKKGKRNVR